MALIASASDAEGGETEECRSKMVFAHVQQHLVDKAVVKREPLSKAAGMGFFACFFLSGLEAAGKLS